MDSYIAMTLVVMLTILVVGWERHRAIKARIHRRLNGIFGQ